MPITPKADAERALARAKDAAMRDLKRKAKAAGVPFPPSPADAPTSAATGVVQHVKPGSDGVTYGLYRGMVPVERDRAAPFRIDAFRAFVEAGEATIVEPTGIVRHERVVDKRNPASVATQKRLLALVDQLRVFAISPELLEAAMEQTAKVYYRPVLPPVWPALPLWVEWPGAYLGDDPNEPAGFTVIAIIVTREPADLLQRPDLVMTRVTLVGLDHSQKALLYAPNGTWFTEQMGPCYAWDRCSLARTTRPGQQFYTREKADEFEAINTGCFCWEGGRAWTRILWAMMHLIQAHGLTAEDVDRSLPLPPKPKPGASPKAQRAWQDAAWRAKQHNARHPRVVRLSWEDTQYGVRARVVRDADGKRTFAYEETAEGAPTPAEGGVPAAQVREGVVKRAHPRLLIADPTTRWKPPTRIVAVRASRPFSMRVRTHSAIPPVRYTVSGAPEPSPEPAPEVPDTPASPATPGGGDAPAS